MKKNKQKKKRIRRPLDYIILVVAIGVFCFSAFKLGEIYLANFKEKSETNELRDMAKIPELEADLDKFNVNFDELKAINPDVVGWIVVKDTEISYPIVQGKDNDYYLTRTFQKRENYAGAIFMDYRAAGDFSDRNTFIYGHNVYHGTMFAELENYMSKEFFEAHPYIYLYTPQGNYKLQVFSAYTALDTSDSYRMQYSGDEDYMNYFNLLLSKSRYPTNVELSATDRMISLYTCSYENGNNPGNTDAEYLDDRYYIHAKIIQQLNTEEE